MDAWFNFYAANDKTLQYKFKEVSQTTGKSVPTTTGTAHAFLATTEAPDAVTADDSLDITMIHVGRGKWIAPWDASDVSLDTMDDKFPVDEELGYGAGFVIAVHSSGIRVSKPFRYYQSREADI